ANLDIEINYNVLWIDEDMQEGMVLRRTFEQTLGVLWNLPEDVKITYCTHERAIRELANNLYSLVILDHDSYRGDARGPSTLRGIRDLDQDIPIIYTSSSNSVSDSLIRKNVKEIIRTDQLPLRLAELIEKYIEE
ncbi:hypothetical protein KKA95_03235, partial [Patescibacteria group bacterium]|nr:hypothetical protein [Patescibacteria group bacterium]